MTTPPRDTLNKQHNQHSVSSDELMIQKNPIKAPTEENDHHVSLLLNSQHTSASSLTMLDLAPTHAGKKRPVLPSTTNSLEVSKIKKKEREARAQQKPERRESKKKRRSSTKPERRKSTSQRHEGSKEKNRIKSSSSSGGSAAVVGQVCHDAELDHLNKEKRKKSGLKKSKRTPRDPSREPSLSSSSQERKSGRRRSNCLLEQPPVIEATAPPTCLPYVPSLEEGRPKSVRLRSTRSQSFRIPRRNVDLLEFSSNSSNLSPIASVGSREEDSSTAKKRRPRSSSVESKAVAVKRSTWEQGTAPTREPSLTQHVSASVRTERIFNHSSPNLELLQFKRDLVSQRGESFRSTKFERGLDRAVLVYPLELTVKLSSRPCVGTWKHLRQIMRPPKRKRCYHLCAEPSTM